MAFMFLIVAWKLWNENGLYCCIIEAYMCVRNFDFLGKKRDECVETLIGSTTMMMTLSV